MPAGPAIDPPLIDPHATREVAPAAPSTRIGRYTIVRQLGEGSFGRIYLGLDEQLQRQVAIKVPHTHRVHRPEDIESYLNEARILAALDHPGIVPVYDLGKLPGGSCFVVSKFVEGRDLQAVLEAGPLPIEDAIRIVAEVAEALDYAHREGIIHRDIKPANILLDSSGRAHAADFGTAVRGNPIREGDKLVGTPLYMSPEQVECVGFLLDGRSDIFSLGVILYELLTARLPFEAGTLGELAVQISTAQPISLRQLNPNVPENLERICMKAIAKQRTDRFATAGELAAALRSWQHHQNTPQQRAPGKPKSYIPSTDAQLLAAAARRGRSHRRRIVALFVLPLLLAGAWLGYGVVPRLGGVGKQQAAIAQLLDEGGTVYYGYQLDEAGNVINPTAIPGGSDYFADVERAIIGMQVSVGPDGATRTTLPDGPMSLEPLQALPSLAHLVICRPLEEADLEILGTLRQLRTLQLDGTGLGEEQLVELRKQLPDCHVQTLY